MTQNDPVISLPHDVLDEILLLPIYCTVHTGKNVNEHKLVEKVAYEGMGRLLQTDCYGTVVLFFRVSQIFISPRQVVVNERSIAGSPRLFQCFPHAVPCNTSCVNEIGFFAKSEI